MKKILTKKDLIRILIILKVEGYFDFGRPQPAYKSKREYEKVDIKTINRIVRQLLFNYYEEKAKDRFLELCKKG